MDKDKKVAEKNEILDCMGKLGNRKRCIQRPTFAKLQISKLKRMFVDDDYFLGLIDALHDSEYKTSEFDALKKALKDYELL